MTISAKVLSLVTIKMTEVHRNLFQHIDIYFVDISYRNYVYQRHRRWVNMCAIHFSGIDCAAINPAAVVMQSKHRMV